MNIQLDEVDDSKNEFGIRYFILEPELVFDENLRSVDWIVFAMIELLDNADHCFATNAFFARILKTTEVTISTSIARLIDNGYIQKESFDGRRRVLSVKSDYKETHSQTLKDFKGSIKEKLVYNINNIGVINEKSFSKENDNSAEALCSNSIRQVSTIRRRTLTIPPSEQPTNNTLTEQPTNHILTIPPSEQPTETILTPITDRTKKRKAFVQEPPLLPISEKVAEIVRMWSEENLHMPTKNSSMNSVTSQINKLLRGRVRGLYPAPTKEQIEIAIKRYALAAFDNQFEPSQPEKKTQLQKQSLNSFIFNSFAKGPGTSWLKFFMENEPIPCKGTIPLVEDKYPTLTNRIKSFYFKKVLGGNKRKLLPKEEDNFRKAGIMISDVYDKNISKMNGYLNLLELSDYLCTAILESWGGDVTKLYPGSFCNLHARDSLIKYLRREGILESGENYARIPQEALTPLYNEDDPRHPDYALWLKNNSERRKQFN